MTTPSVAAHPAAASSARLERATLVLAAVTGLLVLFAVLLEGGTVTTLGAAAGETVHELFHDARHLLGVPCH